MRVVITEGPYFGLEGIAKNIDDSGYNEGEYAIDVLNPDGSVQEYEVWHAEHEFKKL